MPDRQLLEAALEGLELQRQRIEDQIRQVRGMIGGGGPRAATKKRASQAEPAAAAPARKKRRKLSAAARKRIAEAQKKRWAQYRKNEKESK